MNLAIVGMNSIGIDLYMTLKDEISDVYLIGQDNEPGMCIDGYRINLEERDLQNIISIVNENIKSECLIYITNDIYYDLVINEYGRTNIWFNDNIQYFGVSYDFYMRMRDKRRYENFLKSYRMGVPEIYDLRESRESMLPVIAKYNGLSHENYQYKSKLITTKDELDFEFSQQYAGSYIFQKYYPPDEYIQYSYGCFVTGGKVIADIYVKQVGQYPQGVSTLVVEEFNRPKEFIDSVKMLLKDEKYDGFIEFEILRSDHELVVIDLNPRPWGWFYILNFKYQNFPELIILQSKVPVEINKGSRVWVNYNRLASGLFKSKSFPVLRYIKINKSFLNSLYFVYLAIKQKAGKALIR